VVEVPTLRLVRRSSRGELLRSELTQRLQEPIPGTCQLSIEDHQRLVDERTEHVDDVAVVIVDHVCAHGLRGGEIEAAVEHGEMVEDRPLTSSSIRYDHSTVARSVA
jgi:hypothetical protein